MISNIISTLKANNLTNDKKKILKENVENTTLQTLLKMTYESKYNYWIRASDMQVNPEGEGEITDSLLADILSHLNGRIVTGNAAREYLQKVVTSLQPDEAQVIIKMINRDMDCKVSTSLINDTWPGTVSEFPKMLAEKFNEKNAKAFYEVEPKDTLKRGIPQLIVQCKSDGGRLEYVTGDGGYSRNGSLVQTHDRFEFLNELFPGYVIDGELVSIDESGKVQSRKVSNGLYTKAVRGTISKAEASTLHFMVWDIIPTNEFWAGQSVDEYRQRFAKLSDMIANLPPQYASRISLIESKIIYYVDEAQTFYGDMLSRGEEGAMLKLLSAKWVNDRSRTILKLKEEKEATLRCVGVTPHTKKFGQIGSLSLETSCGKLFTSCGSGLSDEDRNKDASYFVNQLIDVKYNALIQAKNRESYSMFLPIFKNVRVDVSEADSLEKLL